MFFYYSDAMGKHAPSTTFTTVRDSKSGRLVKIKGAGALKGKMTISKKVDLTKPISGSALRGNFALKDKGLVAKIAPKGTNADRNTSKR